MFLLIDSFVHSSLDTSADKSQPVEVQLLGGIEKVEEEEEIREEAEREVEKGRKGEKRSKLVTFIFIFHFITVVFTIPSIMLAIKVKIR